MSAELTRLSTGIDRLDSQLEGGLPAGSFVLITAAPASRATLLLHRLTAVAPTRYLTTRRSETAIQGALEKSPVDTGDPMVESIPSDPDAIRTAAADDSATITIVDPIDPIERQLGDREDQQSGTAARYWRFLDDVWERTHGTDGLMVFFGLEGRSVPAHRDITEYVADTVFQYEVGREGDSERPQIYVPKLRGGPGLEEPLDVTYEGGFGIDTTRGVA